MFNKAILIGRLVADPEMRTIPSGANVTTFRIAIDRPYTKGGEKKADFIDIVAWRERAEFVCKYFSKGKAIGIEGSIQTRNYEDKNGNKRTAVEVSADRVFFVESKNASGGSGSSSDAPAPTAHASEGGVSYASGSTGDFEVIEDDDLPF